MISLLGAINIVCYFKGWTNLGFLDKIHLVFCVSSYCGIGVCLLMFCLEILYQYPKMILALGIFFFCFFKKKIALCISVLLHKKELKSFSTFSKSALEQFVQPWGYLVFEALVGFPCETLWAWIFLWSTFMITLFLLWELLYLNFLSNWISLGNYPLLTGFHIYLYRCL